MGYCMILLKSKQVNDFLCKTEVILTSLEVEVEPVYDWLPMVGILLSVILQARSFSC